MPTENVTHNNIPLNEWLQAPKVPLSDAVAIPCRLPECSEDVIVASSSEDQQEKYKMLVKI